MVYKIWIKCLQNHVKNHLILSVIITIKFIVVNTFQVISLKKLKYCDNSCLCNHLSGNLIIPSNQFSFIGKEMYLSFQLFFITIFNFYKVHKDAYCRARISMNAILSSLICFSEIIHFISSPFKFTSQKNWRVWCPSSASAFFWMTLHFIKKFCLTKDKT